MKQLLILTVLSLLPLAAQAQTACSSGVPPRFCASSAPNIACIEWVPPVANTDTTAIAADQKPLVFTVWRRTGSQYVSLVSTQNLFVRIGKQPLGQQCYAVTVTDAKGKSSDLSCFACKTIRFPGPTDGSIDAPTDGSIEK